MILENPRSQERDNQNSLRKFPFSDAASCGNSACVIVPGAIIDAQLYVPARSTGAVWLSSIGDDGLLYFSDESGVFANTSAPITALTAVPVVFTAEGGPLPGGVVVFGEKPYSDELVSLAGQEFSSDETQLAPAAVTHLSLPGVHGFKLDDGNVVSGAVKFKGANGCDVATYKKDGVCYLRISAVGQISTASTITGFITKVVAESNNANFIVSKDSGLSDHVINITAEGVSAIQDDHLSADQESACDQVKKARGTTASASATVPPTCGDSICSTSTSQHTITFMSGTTKLGELKLLDGTSLGSVTPPTYGDGTKRFCGYFETLEDDHYKLYYRADGTGVGNFTKGEDVTLYAYWRDAVSGPVEVTFQNYGTLHLAAPDADLPKYANPIVISGIESPIPTVTEIHDDALVAGGEEALSDIILHPSVPSGEVHIGIRGLDKAYSS